jgi:hypothetical protein
MQKQSAIGLVMATLGMAILAVGNQGRLTTFSETLPGVVADSPKSNAVAGNSDRAFPETAKLTEEAAEGKTCSQYADAADTASVPAESAKVDSAGKRVTVSSLVDRALVDQMRLLVARQDDLERWSRADQAHFAKWFGTNHPDARELIYERIRILTLLNKEYSVGNFRRAVPSRPGLFAFVHSDDPSKIFVDQAFVTASVLGENSRPGTITHEMSHFKLAGGTKDIAYGVRKCKKLARQSPAKALSNADNFEFFVEGVR